MRKTTYTASAHTADTTQPPADASQATNGLPNRLMTAFEVAEFIGCHEETVRRAYLRGLLVSQVDDFAFPRGATAPITSKQEAEKMWEPKFIAEIASGKDPRKSPQRESMAGKPTTVADLLSMYRERYVNVERLKSRHTALSQLRILTVELSQLPTTALERPEAIEDFKARCSGRAIATTNRYLARLRHICNWAIGRELLTATPFHRRGRES
jgi:hypothetical protein